MSEHSFSVAIRGDEGRCVLDGVDISDAVLRDTITLTPGEVNWHVTLTLSVDRLDLDVEGVDVIGYEWKLADD